MCIAPQCKRSMLLPWVWRWFSLEKMEQMVSLEMRFRSGQSQAPSFGDEGSCRFAPRASEGKEEGKKIRDEVSGKK